VKHYVYHLLLTCTHRILCYTPCLSIFPDYYPTDCLLRFGDANSILLSAIALLISKIRACESERDGFDVFCYCLLRIVVCYPYMVCFISSWDIELPLVTSRFFIILTLIYFRYVCHNWVQICFPRVTAASYSRCALLIPTGCYHYPCCYLFAGAKCCIGRAAASKMVRLGNEVIREPSPLILGYSHLFPKFGVHVLFLKWNELYVQLAIATLDS